MDLQSMAFREAGPDDWAVEVPTEEPRRGGRTAEEWDSLGWDVEAAGPKTLEQARTALAERVAGSAPDDDATAYDDLDEEGSYGGIEIPRGAGLWVPWLADAARSSGLPVVETAGWRGRGHGPMRVVEGVVGHHTATGDAAKGDYPSLNIVTNGRAGLPGPLCNFGLGRGGTVYVVAAGVGYHAGASRWAGFVDLNDEFLGIEAEDNGDGRWTDAMLNAYPRLVAALLRYMHRGTDRYISHRGCAVPAGRKPDPGGLSDQWMRDQAGRYMGGPTPGPGPAPAPVRKKKNMLENHDIPPGTGGRRFVTPCGTMSGIIQGIWISFTVNGPKPGKVRFFFQDDDSGIADGGYDIGFRDGRSDRKYIGVPDGSTQTVINYDFPDGGTIGLEILGK